MYQVNGNDSVVELADAPQSSIGAPTPVVLSNEAKVVLAFHLQDTPADWDGTTIRIVTNKSEGPIAIVEFEHCYSFMFGPPNDEAFSGHPLASRGLEPYGAFEILESSWIRILEKMNSVHEYHDPERFWSRHHYIFSFHDSTFECVAGGFTVAKIRHGLIESILPMMAEKLWASK